MISNKFYTDLFFKPEYNLIGNEDPWERAGLNWKDKIDKNMEPVIGIMTQTLEDYMKEDPRFEQYDSYIMSAYVKYIQSAGARVVPIVRG